MQTLLYAVSALSVISVILLIVLIVKISELSKYKNSSQIKELSVKSDIIFKTLGEESAKNRDEIKNMTDAVNSKLADVTKSNYDSQVKLMRLVTNSLKEISETNSRQNEKNTEKIERSLDKMRENNEKKLDEMRATVDEKLTSTLTSRLDSSFKTVSDQLSNVYKSLGEMQELSGGIANLNKLFTNVKTRGTWAEYQLEAILEGIIPNMYVKNYKAQDGAGVVEFAVKIPSAGSKKITYMPVDSKFPTEDYARLCLASESGDSEGVENARKALEKRIADEAKTVSKYINEPETTPFAVMYLATEGLYAQAVSSKNMLLEKIQNEYRVIIAGPSTVTALLSSLAVGFRTAAINEKAGEIRELLSAVKKQYGDFDAVLRAVKKKIQSADDELEKAVKRNEIINKKLKNVGEIDAERAEYLLSDSE